jgi:hypothetical protein
MLRQLRGVTPDLPAVSFKKSGIWSSRRNTCVLKLLTNHEDENPVFLRILVANIWISPLIERFFVFQGYCRGTIYRAPTGYLLNIFTNILCVKNFLLCSLFKEHYAEP